MRIDLPDSVKKRIGERAPDPPSAFKNFADRQTNIYAQRDAQQQAIYDAYERNRQEIVKAFEVSDTNPRAISRQQYDQLSKAARETRDRAIQSVRRSTQDALNRNASLRKEEEILQKQGNLPPLQHISIGDFGRPVEYAPVALPESYYQSPDYVRPPDQPRDPMFDALFKGEITQEQAAEQLRQQIPEFKPVETHMDAQRKQAKEIFDSLNITPEMIEGGPANYEKALENYAVAIGMMGAEGVTKRLQEQIAPPPPPPPTNNLQIMEYQPNLGAVGGAIGNSVMGLAQTPASLGGTTDQRLAFYDAQRQAMDAQAAQNLAAKQGFRDPYQNAFDPFTGSYAYQRPNFFQPPPQQQFASPQQQQYQPQFFYPQQQGYTPPQQYFSPYMNQFQPTNQMAGNQFYQQPSFQPQQPMGFQPQGGKGFQPQGGMRGGFQPQFGMGGKGGGGGKGGFY